MKHRRQSRELALQALYTCEATGDRDVEAALAYAAAEGGYGTCTRKYAAELATRTLAAIDEIDRLIAGHAANWDIGRMAATDRNVLRMAVAELRFFPDVPFRVTIDEAVEIAKKYGTGDSGKFVNGVLDSVRKKLDHDSSERKERGPDAVNNE